MTPDRLRGILDGVESSLDQSYGTGGDLAGRAFLSRFHFSRLVSGAVGEPPGGFRRRLLLERAAWRLTVTGDAVIEVALDAGYGSPEAFARAFSRAYGVPPSRYRHRPGVSHELPAPSGIHFHPPGGLRLPAAVRSTDMDVLVQMLDHHLWLTSEIIERSGRLDDAALDQPIGLSVEGIDAEPSLRRLDDRLVGQLEMWITALEGGSRVPPAADASPSGLRRRLAAAGPRFRELILAPVQEGRAGDTFVDATCDPPQTFTYGGVLAHVLTFSAVRRTMAIGALESAGITDLGAGDPMSHVGGAGDDASEIRRNRA